LGFIFLKQQKYKIIIAKTLSLAKTVKLKRLVRFYNN